MLQIRYRQAPIPYSRQKMAKSVVKIPAIKQDKICQISGNRTRIALKDKKTTMK